MFIIFVFKKYFKINTRTHTTLFYDCIDVFMVIKVNS
jgi:hypothetical protein